MDEGTSKTIRRTNRKIMCLYPRLVPNKRYTENSKNGGVIPAVYDKRALSTPAICGDCMECRKQKAREWQVRLTEHIKENHNGIMVTLTFSTKALAKIAEDERHWLDRKTGELRTDKIKDLDGYQRDNAIVTRATRLFVERWRKEYKVQPKHWLVSELGHTGTEHVHIHGIIWTPKIEEVQPNGKLKDITRAEITRIWQYGWTFNGDYVNGRTINYCVKYVSKQDQQHKTYKPIILASKGLGSKFVKNIKEQIFNYENTKDYYRTPTGHKIAMPQYWRRKIYTDEQREAMWMAKLNQNIRYVDGIKINLNKVSEEQYYKTLKEAQDKNKRLGYKDGTHKWKREQYEKERRNLIWEYRMRTMKK